MPDIIKYYFRQKIWMGSLLMRWIFNKKELSKMGADIEICGKNAIIKGTAGLRGCEVTARDLRGGAALVLAGLMAEGRTRVSGIEHIDRGYEALHKGIRELGGVIERRTT